jgi:hypothetical protein
MKMMKKLFLIILSVFFVFSFWSCTTEVTIKENSNGIIDISFSGAAGQAFAKMISSSSDYQSDTVIFETDQIQFELLKSGFENVDVKSKTGSDLQISMQEKTKNTFLYKSGLFSGKENLKITLSPKELTEFYKLADEQIILFLDLLLAPIFNDEVMSQEEYLETIASFYGESASKEISESNIKINLTDKNNQTKTFSFPIAQLLTLQETIILENK